MKNMNSIKEIAKYRGLPFSAKGHPCIMLTDPLTGKVVQKVEGDNHVFTDALFMNNSSQVFWPLSVNLAYLCLMNDTTAIDTTFPYLLGEVVGYGKPSNAGSGNYQGAYNSTNQVLASQTLDSIRWLFQYDFTTAQANGIINSVGLTYQFDTSYHFGPINGFNYPSAAISTSAYGNITDDGAYTYTCSTAGIITKHSLYFNTNTTIDVSATVGASSSVYKHVGYAPATGKFYIYTYSSTTSLRYVYVFSDSTFSTLENTYAVSNINFGSSNYPLYVYENYMFSVRTNSIYCADFVNNTAYTQVLSSSAPSNHITPNVDNLYYSTIGYGKYIFGGIPGPYTQYIFDMSNRTFVGTFAGNSSAASYPRVKNPILDTFLTCVYDYTHYNPAITKYVLPTPVEKTSAYGLTATYELEVNWS